ncbi:MAG TPA: serine hydrolase domain-containing protein [Fimbriimonas sp.]|nr:serine hydrolase domain-containing protein [Fimbriimonas sp.]
MLIALVAVAGLLQRPPQIEPQAAFDARLDSIFSKSGAPGAGLRVAIKGKTVYQRAFGYADEAKKTPMKLSDSFEIGSLSKQFTAVCALMLVKDGKLDLSEKLGDIIPKVPPAWKSATIDQILHHMSGIPDYEEIATYDFYNKKASNQDVIDQARKKEPAFKPGERFEYSNTGYYLVGMVVEKRSGIPMSQFLRKRVFDKVGMKSTYAEPSTSKPATGYHSRTGSRVAQPPIEWSSTLGAGGIVSTLDDLVKWDNALYTEKLLPRALLDKLWKTTKFNNGTTNTYGYGWFVGNFRGVNEQEHSGQTNGFTCVYRRFPDQKCSVWAFTNTYGGDVVFGLAQPALIRYLDAVNYAKAPFSASENGERTARHLQALTQATGVGSDYSLLAPNMKSFATEAGSAPSRDAINKYLSESKEFRFLRLIPRESPSFGKVELYVYRQLASPADRYWSLAFANGLLISVRMEDE